MGRPSTRPRRRTALRLLVVGVAAVQAVCSRPPPDARTAAAVGQEVGWTANGGDLQGTRYLPVQEIDRENVQRLEVAWTYRTGETEPRFATRADGLPSKRLRWSWTARCTSARRSDASSLSTPPRAGSDGCSIRRLRAMSGTAISSAGVSRPGSTNRRRLTPRAGGASWWPPPSLSSLHWMHGTDRSAETSETAAWSI